MEASYERESNAKSEYFNSLNNRVKKIIYRDTRYNIDYLYTAYVLDDKKIMNTYAVWLYELMAGIHKQRFTREQTREYVLFHLESIRKTIPDVVSPEKQQKLQEIIEEAQQSIRTYIPSDETKPDSKYEKEIEEYMDCLFHKDTRKAIGMIRRYMDQGMELHEMGARIVTDLFENHGWDSIFLGAAVLVDYILDSVRENHPDLVTLSVSMPQHLMDCEQAVREIRREFPDIKIAVGGKAFESTDDIWKKWPVDIYSRDARELLARADKICA